jgi:hypothetical protein
MEAMVVAVEEEKASARARLKSITMTTILAMVMTNYEEQCERKTRSFELVWLAKQELPAERRVTKPQTTTFQDLAMALRA